MGNGELYSPEENSAPETIGRILGFDKDGNISASLVKGTFLATLTREGYRKDLSDNELSLADIEAKFGKITSEKHDDVPLAIIKTEIPITEADLDEYRVYLGEWFLHYIGTGNANLDVNRF